MAPAQKIVNVAGYPSCGFYSKVVKVLQSLTVLFPTRIKFVNHEFHDRAAYRQWLLESGVRDNFREATAKQHSASPFCWLSKTDSLVISSGDNNPKKEDIEKFLGGHDEALKWCRELMAPCEDETENGATMKADGHTADHSYDYDLIVIGGGSGGMAASKEAAGLGAKVACLDFVKPSPKGTTWGLGGTCVNVGCIPKKLFHAGSLLHESIKKDAPAYGVQVGGDENFKDGFIQEPATKVHWGVLRENIQNYIRSLNFKYRVRLREKEVTYLNKLGKFLDPHTIEVVDKKGRVSTLTSSRFLIATGGRPTPLQCEGGELAISSDDVFALEESPGKTLCVGASYISLECAGFLAGIGLDVTVAVRSILLRGFDRECSDKIGEYMKDHGVQFRNKVTPTKLEKTESNQIKVTFSDGSEDTYDTVLSAIGRQADTDKLGLDKIGVEVNPKNKRIPGTLEQTACPNVYAVGDVLDDTPELTPVAIQAGVLLSRRLFGESKEAMDYLNVCTTVFTPLEYGCVGYSEDEAIEKFGESGVEVNHREFLPLEWSLSLGRTHSFAYAKIIVDKTPQQNVLGMHFLGPNAGEVLQGYGVSMKQGLTFKALTDTVGIHPTSSEELVTMSVTKSSGEDCSAGGC
mmetsp:Transcript_20540/g.56699  ORF Transcript_20540/g.56699 Transcript_20540/m.56699 type:complete len:632 (+) Transcript_20540:71-1966(+)|eukprot:CAMPEP_0168737890 /NCGR_PEP_ID=MMETSP0724-20121128/10639_1 /TAXON_ID=265536 /ORGANISM="Amphiprora sp., Strain CCMP467" /LENGTH=631 /DNA_ID=CAMNT_0008785193 /DNA_START=61 /DNA_END=1956 /DNA_ORIENTATION=+